MERPQLAPGEEWVWDYPRTDRAWRVLETSHPPVYYIPRTDVRAAVLRSAVGGSFCEWKGVASYYDVVVGEHVAARAAWTYEEPMHPYEALAGAIAFYPGRMEACFVDDERVRPQEGDFYGGWITHEIVGPIKGAPGRGGW